VVGKTLIIGSQTGRIVALPLDVIKGAHDKAAPATVAKGAPGA
jgi:hypothetical protein